MTESEWCEKLREARVALYWQLQTRDVAEAALEVIREETDKAVAHCNEVRDQFDLWLLEQAGIKEQP